MASKMASLRQTGSQLQMRTGYLTSWPLRKSTTLSSEEFDKKSDWSVHLIWKLWSKGFSWRC